MTRIRTRWISAWLGAAALGIANGVSREVRGLIADSVGVAQPP